MILSYQLKGVSLSGKGRLVLPTTTRLKIAMQDEIQGKRAMSEKSESQERSEKQEEAERQEKKNGRLRIGSG